jgi:autotransporter passenger strand-loop-strand repeat protein
VFRLVLPIALKEVSMSGTDIYLSSGGTEIAEGDSLSGFIVPNGGTLVVLSGGSAGGVVVDSGAVLSVASG